MKETINRKRHAIAIVGNMNVGKSTLFSRMCGKSATSVNIAGTTVSINRGWMRLTLPVSARYFLPMRMREYPEMSSCPRKVSMT